MVHKYGVSAAWKQRESEYLGNTCHYQYTVVNNELFPSLGGEQAVINDGSNVQH